MMTLMLSVTVLIFLTSFSLCQWNGPKECFIVISDVRIFSGLFTAAVIATKKMAFWNYVPMIRWAYYSNHGNAARPEILPGTLNPFETDIGGFPGFLPPNLG